MAALAGEVVRFVVRVDDGTASGLLAVIITRKIETAREIATKRWRGMAVDVRPESADWNIPKLDPIGWAEAQRRKAESERLRRCSI